MTEKINIPARLKRIESQLPAAMHADRQAVKREINWIRHKGAKPPASPGKIIRKIFELEKRVQQSAVAKQWRKDHLPHPVYDENLPIISKKDEIIEAIKSHQVIIVSGETGSGKTTQLPKFCIEAGRGVEGIIGHTQPRRIAAVTVAHRIAEELSEQPGQSVGYKIRFQDRFSAERSFIKLMTDGILLAEVQGDKYLNDYDTLIIDEAHERSLNIDFILGMLRSMLKVRRDLKLIVTSATIDTEKFSNAFAGAPVIEVSGRLYPVEVQYAPYEAEEDEDELTYVEKAVDAVDRIIGASRSGDILIFMPTEQDIRETWETLSGRKYNHTTVLPLFARLPAADQMRIFEKTSGRKIIAATNVAETSITVPGIRYVVDTGLARMLRYDPRSRTTALPISPISRSSADQRKGRCGRLENGICVRLYSEEDYTTRLQYTPPEILRANLAEVILRMIALDLGDVKDFPFIDPPPARQIKDGFDMLFELGAIEIAGKKKTGQENISLTEQGRLMAKIPLDPRLSRMLIEAAKKGCLGEVAVIVAAITVPDPRERPEENIAAVQEAHSRFKDPASDFITLYNIWKACFGEPNSKKIVRARDLKKFCKSNFMSFKRMREWQDVHEQIADILEESGVGSNDKEKTDAKSTGGFFSAGYTAIHQSILSGFLSNIALRKEKNIYQATKQREVMIFPGSGLFNKGGDWIVAADIVETSRLFARTVANIDNCWLEALGRPQCRYSYSNPRWEKKREAVVADEQVSLYGLVIVAQRAVVYGLIHPNESSAIFIRRALIEGDVKTTLPFMTHNWTLVDTIHDMENRIRRRDLLVSEAAMLEFYTQRLSGIYDMTGLRKKIKAEGSDAFLRMSESDLLAISPDSSQLELFPERMPLGDSSYPIEYKFEPGKDDDGVTVQLPVSAASSVPAETTDWIVPGLLEEKITNLIKGLPKGLRKQLVPVSDTVAVIMKEMPKFQGSLVSSLSSFIYKRFGVDIPASAWQEDMLPDYLKIRIALTGLNGNPLGASRDRAILSKSILSEGMEQGLLKERRKWEKTDLIEWDFPDLPEAITITDHHGSGFPVFVGLEKEEDKVNLRLFKDRLLAEQSHKQGVAQLYCLYFAKDLKYLKKNLTLSPQIQKAAFYFGGTKKVEAWLFNRVVADLFSENIRTKKDFFDHAQAAVNQILPAGKKTMENIVPIMQICADARDLIATLEKANAKDPMIRAFLAESKNWLSRIIPDNFIELYDFERMKHLGRYVKAIILRAQRGIHDMDKDRKKAAKVAPFADSLNELIKGLTPATSSQKREAVEALAWMIEEYKVSLFAQELKTAFPISPKKIEDKIKEIRRLI